MISRYRTAPDEAAPIALTRDGPHGPIIHALNGTALERGIRPLARVVDVQAIHPDLHVEQADPPGDQAFLERLTHWARRWCPWTVSDADNGLILDTTGSAHLFGGETALLRDMIQRFAIQGLTARVAMAPTRGAAQALARYGAASTLCDDTDMAPQLDPLPVNALQLEAETARLLDRLGLKTIGALNAVPRSTLMRRFSGLSADRNPLILLDRTLGRAADPVNAPPDAAYFMARTRLAEPVIDPVPYLDGLAQRLCRDLAQAEQGARHLRLTIYRIDGEWRTVDAATARASRDPAHLVKLFDGKLDSMDPGFGFDLLTLEAGRVEPLCLHQDRLDGTRDANADVAALLDRLTARLGAQKVTWSTWSESHKPEDVETLRPALQTEPSAPLTLTVERPIRLLQPAEEVQVLYAVPEGPPSQFRWRRVVYRMTRYTGPERIAPEWWKDRPGTRLRDYYKVEIEDGRRFWLYRDGVVHDGRGGDPRWFLHGFFA
ncbi:hypothetical protein KIN_24460 [Litoreibacter roseus]|uniref:Protein ImuB n=2 Tax=Litoreibacter roseus TaxID=2601869 RepID=A0A6N6JJK3_9RHOB|nr:hypothetical protein KIN_24460 [Litoreibacter roseus]